MTDVEMMRIAAKVAGYELADTLDGYPLYVEGYGIWNPLTDDGDAFRLAVKLRLDMHFNDGFTFVSTMRGAVGEEDSDSFVAARRAIVRAAALIGEKSDLP